MKNICVFTVLLFLFIAAKAQSDLPAFGSYSPQEIAMRECSFDKQADAVVLFDDAVAGYDDRYQLHTKRRVRIKILNEKGIDKGNIVIPFYSENHFETIIDIHGQTFDPAENVISALEQKSIYTEKLND